MVLVIHTAKFLNLIISIYRLPPGIYCHLTRQQSMLAGKTRLPYRMQSTFPTPSRFIQHALNYRRQFVNFKLRHIPIGVNLTNMVLVRVSRQR